MLTSTYELEKLSESLQAEWESRIEEETSLSQARRAKSRAARIVGAILQALR
ncbi:hypothetical protein [Cohnella nanjingensis]|uniref:Uncharacterized protein n=1 Tax=Cohnella nanjingensis TaxID=1387779 RepID=A0A7X0RQD6_9BACL|nr:hypothetical protein [Cohnella nanjingensis]MBB6670354.1 hypothetical protein [Cohnella nanjingensis]